MGKGYRLSFLGRVVVAEVVASILLWWFTVLSEPPGYIVVTLMLLITAGALVSVALHDKITTNRKGGEASSTS